MKVRSMFVFASIFRCAMQELLIINDLSVIKNLFRNITKMKKKCFSCDFSCWRNEWPFSFFKKIISADAGVETTVAQWT